MNTLVDTMYSCMKISGYSNTEYYDNKEMSHVNLLSKGIEDKAILYLDSGTSITLTISDSVLLSQNNKLVQFDGMNDGFSLVLNNCIIPSGFNGYDNNKVKTSNCNTNSYNKDLINIYPHFTYGDLCKGDAPIEEDSAKNCNIGNCIENCERSIEFPKDVFTYTTIFHGDIQTATPTPTSEFSGSSYFSQSLKFSQSDAFSDSLKFTKSLNFEPSGKLAKSNEFSQSKRFSSSRKFSSSSEFSSSSKFSMSSIFGGGNKNVDDNKKLGTGPLIGIIVGSVAAAAIIAAIAAFFIIRKRRNAFDSDSADMVETKDSSITVDNDLNNVMDEDDPFAEGFNH